MDEAFMKERALHICNLAEKLTHLSKDVFSTVRRAESRLGRPSFDEASFEPTARKSL